MAIKRSDKQQQVREAQIRWLDRVVAETGMSLTEIARKGQLTPSTLTRFRNDGARGGTMAVRTISTVADVTRVDVPPEIVGASERPAGLREREAEPYQVGSDRSGMAASIAACVAGRNHVVPWLLRSRSLEYAGFRPGDVLIVDLNAEPHPGDVVCAQLYDWQRGGAETVFRLYQPPILIGAGPDEGVMKPRFIDDPNVAIKGVMLTSLRDRMGRAA